MTTAELKRHVEVLADDTFEGRKEGTRGGRAAGGYIRKRLADAGLQPAGDDGYFQSLPSGGRNLLAAFPGSDPKLSQEYILIGAHYDHVGYGTPSNSYGPTGYIHNGADDNASGVSALLELADSLQHLSQAPRRSLLLAFWDGEENGLLGSKHWVAHPTKSWDRIRFVINMDMVGRLENRTLHVYGTRSASNLRPLVSTANSGVVPADASTAAMKLDFDWETKPNSDHYPFFERNVPYLMFHTGLHGNYHRPSDDAHLLNYSGMRDVSRLLLASTLALADNPQAWKFRSAARQEGPASKQQLERQGVGSPPRLGVSWRRDDRPGLPVTSLVYRGAAEQGGVRLGDRILAFNGQPVGTDAEFQLQVRSTVGNVSMQVERGEQQVDLNVQLRGTPLIAGGSWRGDAANPGLLLLSHVARGGPAESVGLRVGDRIYSVDDEPATAARLRDAFAQQTGRLQVERDGQVSEVVLERDAP